MNPRLCRLVLSRPPGLFGRACRRFLAPSQRLVLALALALALGQAVLVPRVCAQIVADPGAPGSQRPTVLEAGNGVPLVNIQTPSAAGVSRNTYRQFDVAAPGAILNNSRTPTQTQLGGWVQGNPWLARGGARVILNEVNTSDPSQLRGYLEVAGERAQLVIANPAGIACDGCGFINADRAVITTGMPGLHDGSLEGYRVQGGAIEVRGQGMDASGTAYADLIARAVRVNAGIWARQLNVTTGANEVDADAGKPRPGAARGAAPVFALDVGALGGMYSQHILLIGTEHGVGMRNAGTLGAQADELIVTADGRLENSGALQARGDIRIEARGGVANTGTVSAGRELGVDTAADIDNSQGVLNARRIEVNARTLKNRAGAIEQTGAQDLALRAAHASNREGGRIGLAAAATPPGNGAPPGTGAGEATAAATAGGDTPGGGAGGGQPVAAPLADGVLNLAVTLDNDGGRIMAGGAIDVTATAGFNNAGGHLGARRFDVSGGDLSNRAGDITVAAAARFGVDQLNNDAGLMQLAGPVALEARDLSNRGGTLQQRDTADTRFQVEGRLDNREGVLVSQARHLSLDAGHLLNTDGRIVHSGDAGLHINAGTFSGAGGQTSTAGALRLRLGAGDHRKARLNAARVDLEAQSFDNRGGKLIASGSAANRLNVAGTLDNGDGGVLVSQSDLLIRAGVLGNARGGILHAGQGRLDITAQTLRGEYGSLVSHGTLDLKAGVTDLTGAVTQAQAIKVATDALTTAQGRLTANGSAPLDLHVRDAWDNRGGLIASDGALDLRAQSLDNRGATVLAAGTDASRISVAGRLDNSAKGTLAAGGDLTLSAATLDNRDGSIQHAGDGTLRLSAATLQGAGGTIASNGGFDLSGEHTDLSHATTLARRLSVDTGTLTTAGGTLTATGTGPLTVHARDRIDNTGGAIAGNGALDLQTGALANEAGKLQAAGDGDSRIAVAGQFDNQRGRVITAGDTTITADSLNNQSGTVAATGQAALTARVAGLLDNSAKGTLAAGGDLTLSAATLDNRDGSIQHAGDGTLRLSAATLQGAGGTIASNGGFDLSGEHTDLNHATTLARRLSVDTGTLTTAGGTLTATGTGPLTVRARDRIDNTGGAIAGNGVLDLQTVALVNEAGNIQAAGNGDSRIAVAGAFDNQRGSVITAGDTTLTADSLNNQSGTVAATGQAALTTHVDGLLDNSAKGTLAAGGDLTLSAATLDNRDGSIQHAGDGTLRLSAATLQGAGGTIASNGDLDLSGALTDLSHATTLARRIRVDTGTLTTAGGTLTATGTGPLTVRARDRIDNTGGAIAGNGALDLQTGALSNEAGNLQAAGNGDSRIAVAGQFDNQRGSVITAGDTTITADSLNNLSGTVAATGQAALSAHLDGLLDNSAKGTLAAGGDLTLSAATLDNQDGSIQHAGDGTLRLSAAALQGAGGTIASNGGFDLSGERTDLSHATTLARRISVDTGTLTTAGGTLTATGIGPLTMRARDRIDNTGGTIAGNGALDLQTGALTNEAGNLQAAGNGDSRIAVAGQFDNQRGSVITAGDTTITADSLNNQSGTVAATGQAALSAHLDRLLDNSAKGTLAAGGDLTLSTATLDNREGAIQHAGDGAATVFAHDLQGAGGTIASNGDLDLSGEHTDLSHATTLARRIRVDTGTLTTAGGTLTATGTGPLTVHARDRIDNTGGTIVGNGVLDLKTGALTNEAGNLQAAGNGDSRIAVVGQFDNQRGSVITAGDTTITADSLNNQSGTIAATGQAALSTHVDGLLDNSTKGTFAAGGDLTLSAAMLDNQDGSIQHAGDGTLRLSAAALQGAGGTIASNGGFDLSGERTDLSHATTLARRISVDTGTLTTAGGTLMATGIGPLTMHARDRIDNTGGAIAGNGVLDLQTVALVNEAGNIQAAGNGDSRIAVAGQFDNQRGSVITAGDTTITANSLNNQSGTVAATGQAALSAHLDRLLDNSAKGTLAAGGDLTLSAATLDNQDGSIQHAGDGTLRLSAAALQGAGGTIASNGGFDLSGERTDLSHATTLARRIRVDTGTLTTAGGTLTATGTGPLTVHARDRIDNTGGTIVGNGVLDLQTGALANEAGNLQAAGNGDSRIAVAGQFDNQRGSVITAGDTTLTADSLNNQSGTVAATGQAALTTHVDRLLDNSAKGTLAAGGDLTLSAATLDNREGAIQHAGDGAATVFAHDLQGAGGTIASNGDLDLSGEHTDLSHATTLARRLSVDTGTLTAAGGTLTATGSGPLTMHARDRIDNTGGTIAGNGALDLQTGALANEAGKLQAAGDGDSRIAVAGQFDNQRGSVITAGDTTLTADSLNNQSGTIATTGQADNRANGTRAAGLAVTVAGKLDNRAAGLIASAGKAAVQADALDNHGGALNAAGPLSASVQQALDNRAGKLVSAADLEVTAGTLDNRDGGLAVSLDGPLGVDSRGRTENAGGTLQSGGAMRLRNTGFGNAGGTALGASIGIDTGRHALENTGGVIASTRGRLDVDSGALNNTGGLLQSAQDLRVDTHGQTLRNTAAGETGGLRSGGTLTLDSGSLDNRGGLAQGQADLIVRTGELGNRGGQLGGNANVDIAATALDNGGGSVQAGQDLNVRLSGVLDNERGLLIAGAGLTVNAAGILNRATQSADPDKPLGLQGERVMLSARHIDNSGGAIAADAHIGIRGTDAASVLENRRGQISSDGRIDLALDHVLNPQGTLLAGQSLSVTAARLSGDGSLLSKGDLSLQLQQDFTLFETITANGQARLHSEGILTNHGKIQAGGLDLRGARVHNSATGVLSADRLSLAAPDTLTNRGLIDGGQARIDAGTLDNVGTGRLYGDHLAIQADRLDNREEDGRAGVIAARQRLDLGVGRLHNREQALILSAGGGRDALNIGGALDADAHASGQARDILNDSATLESLGGLTLDSARLFNRNLHFDTQQVQVSGPVLRVYLQPEGDPDKHDINEYERSEWSRAGLMVNRKTGAQVKNWTQYDVTRTEYETQVSTSAPALIRSGGDMTLRGGELVNDKSQIIAGGLLQGDLQHLKNTAVLGEHVIHEEGTGQYTYTRWRGGFKRYHEREPGSLLVYRPADEVQTILLDVSRTEQNASGGSSRRVDERQSGQVSGAVGGSARVARSAGLKPITQVQAAVTALIGPPAALDGPISGGPGPDRIEQAAVVGQNGPVQTQADPVQAWDGIGARSPAAVDVVDVVAGPGSQPLREAQVNAAGGPHAASGGPTRSGPGPDRLEPAAVAGPNGPGQTQAAPVQARDAPQISPPAAVDGLAGPGGQPLRGADGANNANSTNNANNATEPTFIRTVEPNTQVPANSLLRPAPRASGYLIETDPRFTNYRHWLGSDYLLSQLRHDPAWVHKRLGDGFYEQQLVRDQIGQLTGRRFLQGYASDEAQYRALLQAGVTYARQWNLRPGVALSAEQMAQLTSDMVWLVEREVTLADGTVTRALVPQVYVRVLPGDLDSSGSLIAADSLDLKLDGDLNNSGTLAGRRIVRLTAETLRNLNGRISGDAVALQARADLDNLGGRIQAGAALSLEAGRDINLTSTTRSDAKRAGASDFSRTHLDRVAVLYVADANGVLLANAGRDLNLGAAQVLHSGAQGQTALLAGRDLNLSSVKIAAQENLVQDANNYLKQGYVQDVGSRVQTGGALRLQAGRDLSATAATVSSEHGALSATAGNALNLQAGQSHSHWSEGHQHTHQGWFNSSTKTTRDSLEQRTALASTFSGNTLDLRARNITLSGSNAVADAGTVVTALNDLTLQAAIETEHQDHFKQVTKSGMLYNGGLALTTHGKQRQSNARDTADTHAAGATIGSTAGSVTLFSGNHYQQIGSRVLAPKGDIDLHASKVDILEAQESGQSQESRKFRQSGVTVALSGPVISAIQAGVQVTRAAGQSTDTRMQALAGATSALAAVNAYEAVRADPQAGGGLKISITVGASKSDSQTRTEYATVAASSVAAGGDLRISASGAGTDSTLTVSGSDLNAGGNAHLQADGSLNLLAAANTVDSRRRSSSASGGVGVAFTVGQGGLSLGITADASGARGKGDGQDVAWTHSHVTAGDQLTLTSGGDATLRGAVARGRQVVADIGGNLNIDSLQDRSVFQSKDQSIGGSVTAGAGFSGSVNVGQQKIRSDYASVTEQSGLEAGDGGFQIAVQGNTGLTGAAISASAQAVENDLNTLTTGTLSSRDLENRAEYHASGFSLGGGYRVGDGGVKEIARYGDAPAAAAPSQATPGGQTPEAPPDKGGFSASPPVALSASGNSASTTRSGISGARIAITDAAGQQTLTGQSVDERLASLNRDVLTGQDGAHALKPIFNEQEIRAGFEIVSVLQKETGTFLNNHAKEAAAAQAALDQEQAKPPSQQDPARLSALQQRRDDSALWAPGGAGRQVLTALSVAAGGNVTGASSQFVQDMVVHYVQQQGAGYLGKLVRQGTLKEGSPTHAALHAVVACAGAGASHQDCGSGAMGAATSSLLTDLFQDNPKETAQDKQTRRDLMSTLVTGIAASGGLNAATAMSGAVAAIDNNWLTLLTVSKAENCLSGQTCLSEAERQAERDRLGKKSKRLDEKLKKHCTDNPSGYSCSSYINSSMQYMALPKTWDLLREDVTRSSKHTFEQLYNSPDAESHFASYYDTIDKRADFFAASDQYEQHIGSKAKWFGGADFVSRAPWTGLGADGHLSAITFFGGSTLDGVMNIWSLYDWRAEAGESLMNAGFKNFKDLYNNKPEPVPWDINQLKNEQTVLQPIHDKYLKDRPSFNEKSKNFTDTNNENYKWFFENVFKLDPRQTQSGGIDIIDYKSRIRYGCKLLEYGEKQGCGP